MNYEYRELSKQKSEKLNSRKFINMYRKEVRFDGGARCVTADTEEIVFKQIGISHEEYIADEFILDYYGLVYYVYIFLESRGSEVKENGKNYYKLGSIDRIVKTTFENNEGDVPTEEKIVDVLKEVIPIWKQHNSGRLKVGDNVITEVQYKGVTL